MKAKWLWNGKFVQFRHLEKVQVTSSLGACTIMQCLWPLLQAVSKTGKVPSTVHHMQTVKCAGKHQILQFCKQCGFIFFSGSQYFPQWQQYVHQVASTHLQRKRAAACRASTATQHRAFPRMSRTLAAAPNGNISHVVTATFIACSPRLHMTHGGARRFQMHFFPRKITRNRNTHRYAQNGRNIWKLWAPNQVKKSRNPPNSD